MRCSKSNDRRGSSAKALRWLAWWVLAVGTSAVHAIGFEVLQAKTRLVEDVYLVDADIAFNFSDQALEALANGVPLRVIIDMEVLRKRPLLWDKKVAKRRVDYQLKLHALSNQYVITDLNLGTGHSYLNLEAARAALGTLQNYPLVERSALAAGGEYRLRVRARLDIEALPSPLRPLAYVSSLWHRDSGWYRWPIRQ